MNQIFENGELRAATPEEIAEIEARQQEGVRPLIPASVTRRQARQALLLAGLLDQVQPAIDVIPDPVQRGLLQIEWDDAQDFERNSWAVLMIGAALGLDDDGLDQLFIQAAAR